jgi:hypothetical protein
VKSLFFTSLSAAMEQTHPQIPNQSKFRKSPIDS